MRDDISASILHAERHHDKDGNYFLLDIIQNGTITQWLAEPLDPIGQGEYKGRFKLIGATT